MKYLLVHVHEIFVGYFAGYGGHWLAEYPVALYPVPGYCGALYPVVGGGGYEFITFPELSIPGYGGGAA